VAVAPIVLADSLDARGVTVGIRVVKKTCGSGCCASLDISMNIVTINIDMSVTAELIDCCRPLASVTLAEDEVEATAQLFKALGDPARVKIVNLLARSDGPVCACEIVPALELSQATVSHHLKKLTQAGLLDREQRGKWAYFSLNPKAAAQLVTLVRFPEVAR
jgi:ArsR family transcriptional regulator